MNKKIGIAIVALIILVSVAVYFFAFSKKQNQPAQKQQDVVVKTEPKNEIPGNVDVENAKVQKETPAKSATTQQDNKELLSFDSSVRSLLQSSFPMMLIYADDHNNSFNGFQLGAELKFPACSKSQTVSVSTDGKSAAIFAQLCSDPAKFTCYDSNAEFGDVAFNNKSLCK